MFLFFEVEPCCSLPQRSHFVSVLERAHTQSPSARIEHLWCSIPELFWFHWARLLNIIAFKMMQTFLGHPLILESNCNRIDDPAVAPEPARLSGSQAIAAFSPTAASIHRVVQMGPGTLWVDRGPRLRGRPPRTMWIKPAHYQCIPDCVNLMSGSWHGDTRLGVVSSVQLAEGSWGQPPRCASYGSASHSWHCSTVSMLTQHIVPPSGWEMLFLSPKNNLRSWQGGSARWQEGQCKWRPGVVILIGVDVAAHVHVGESGRHACIGTGFQGRIFMRVKSNLARMLLNQVNLGFNRLLWPPSTGRSHLLQANYWSQALVCCFGCCSHR